MLFSLNQWIQATQLLGAEFLVCDKNRESPERNPQCGIACRRPSIEPGQLGRYIVNRDK